MCVSFTLFSAFTLVTSCAWAHLCMYTVQYSRWHYAWSWFAIWKEAQKEETTVIVNVSYYFDSQPKWPCHQPAYFHIYHSVQGMKLPRVPKKRQETLRNAFITWVLHILYILGTLHTKTKKKTKKTLEDKLLWELCISPCSVGVLRAQAHVSLRITTSFTCTP